MYSSLELYPAGLAPVGSGRLLPCVGVVSALVLVLVLAADVAPAFATDQHYILQSPNLGGTNGAALQMAQLVQSLRASNAAAIATAAKAAQPSDPNSAFVNAIVSQLNGIVAQSIAQKIANSTNGQAGTIQSGNVTITYTNSDGELSVTISSPTGVTTLMVPSGS